MPEYAPACSICETASARLGWQGDFRVYSFWYLCEACRARVLQGGNARERRAAVRERRVATLLGRHPALYVDETAPRRSSLRGRVHGQEVRITIRDSARQYESARFVIRVETQRYKLGGAAPLPPFRIAPCDRGVTIVKDHDGTWLSVGFSHLGNADILHVLDVLCAAAREPVSAPSP